MLCTTTCAPLMQHDTVIVCGKGSMQELSSDAPLDNPVLPVLSAGLVRHILFLVVNSIDERLKLTTHQAAQAFTALCYVVAAQSSAGAVQGQLGQVEDACEGKQVDKAGMGTVRDTMRILIAQPVSKKGRYSLLNVLLPFVGATSMLQERPLIVQECLLALRADTCTVATIFLREFLVKLKSEVSGAIHDEHQDITASTEGSAATSTVPMPEWRQVWLPPLVQLLRDSEVNFRRRLVNYALPMLLQLDAASLPELLRQQQVGAYGRLSARSGTKAEACLVGKPPAPGCIGFDEATVASTIAVLASARSMHLFESLDAVVKDIDGVEHVPCALLKAAAIHHDELLRLQMLELTALSVKSTLVCLCMTYQCSGKCHTSCPSTEFRAQHAQQAVQVCCIYWLPLFSCLVRHGHQVVRTFPCRLQKFSNWT
jgi:hypothetical protein